MADLAGLTDNELQDRWESAHEDCAEIPYVEELWRRYNNKKKECDDWKQRAENRDQRISRARMALE